MSRVFDMRLRAVEELLLFALDGDTGRLRPVPEKALAGAIAGGLLLDLAFAGRLDNDQFELTVLDASPTGDVLLDLALRALPTAKSKVPLNQAIAAVAFRTVDAVETGFRQLTRKGILKQCGSLFGRGRQKRYQKTDLSIESELRDHIRQVVLAGDEIPEPRDVVRIGLFQACQLTPLLFEQEELEMHRERLLALAGLELINQAMLRSIREFQEATYSEIAERLVGISYEGAQQSAGGTAAVISAIEQTYQEVGLLRGSVVLSHLNQLDGFDCPGCAWPHTGTKRHRFEFCENGARALAAQATFRTIDSSFFKGWSVSELSRHSDYWLNQQGRLVQPMILRQGASHYLPIPWEEALDLLADELKQLPSPDEAVFYTSGITSNEAAFLLQLMAREFGTNNLPSSANLCHEASGIALSQTLGFGKGTVRVEDFPQADLILVFGHNTGSNHGRMLDTLQRAVRNGTTIVSVNPLTEAGLKSFSNPHEILGALRKGTPLASEHLQVRINGDQALIQGLIKAVLLEEEKRPNMVLDHEFIDRRTTGFAALQEHIQKLSREIIEQRSGVPWARIEGIARLYVRSKRTIAVWCVGITQHANGVATIRDIVNLLLLRGNVGRPGAGVSPMRGHSNVQGTRTMGIGSRPATALLDVLQKSFGFVPPRTPGLDSISALEAMHDGRVKVFFSLGGNLLSAAPDSGFAAEALRRCRLTALVSTKLNRNHLVTGEQALILPCLSRTEVDLGPNGELQYTTVEDTSGGVHASRGCLDPLSPELRGEPWIIASLASRLMGTASKIPWTEFSCNYERIREAISKIVPGFRSPDEILHKKGAFYLPNPAREGSFGGPDGKARFTTQPLTHTACEPGQFILMTVRSHDQFNTTIHGHNDRYRGIRNARRVLLINPADMECLGVKPGELLDIQHRGYRDLSARCFHAVPYDIPRGCVAAYFPEANAVVPIDHRDPESHTPASKSTVVTLVRSQSSPG